MADRRPRFGTMPASAKTGPSEPFGRVPFSRRGFVFCLGVLVASLLGGCGGAFSPADLTFANGGEPETLDPALITAQLDMRVAYALFEGLTTFNAAGEPQPGVAERWEVSPDGLTYTFHLRRNARWTNGDRVTARDFVESWRRVLTPAVAARNSYQLFYLKNGQRFNDPVSGLTDFSQVGVHAEDDATLRVELEHPTPFFLDLCCTSTLLPVPLPTVQRWGDAWTLPAHIVTNGAFTLDAWRLNDRLRLRKSPGYWNRDAVRLRTVDALPISQANVALNFFSSGGCDLLMDKGLVPVTLVGDLRRKPFFHAAPFLGTFFLRFNCSRPPFNDARVRQAFALVVDKELLVEKITKAGERPAASFTPPGTGGYQPPAPGLGRDPERARRLLAEAGFPGGRGFPSFAFLYNNSEQNQYIGVELKSMFERELGVTMGLRPQENKVYLNTMSSLDYDLARSSWVGDYNDPNTFLDLWVTGGGNNRCGWSSRDYDGLIADAARETDPARRFDTFRRAETLLVSGAAPICPLYFYVGIQLYDGDKVGGIQSNVLDEHPIREMYRKQSR